MNARYSEDIHQVNRVYPPIAAKELAIGRTSDSSAGKLSCAMPVIFHRTLDVLRESFRYLEDLVPKPVTVNYRDGSTLRYAEQSIEQALILKLARYISGMGAMSVLMERGYGQEQAIIQRTLDEIGEDISFLALGVTHGLVGAHRAYLKSFWQEEFEEGVEPIDSRKGRYSKRREVKSYLEQKLGIDPETPEGNASGVMTRFYSAYVHASGPGIMDMCGGAERRFQTAGYGGTGPHADHVRDAWNYAYRGILCAAHVAGVLGASDLRRGLEEFLSAVEDVSGTAWKHKPADS